MTEISGVANPVCLRVLVVEDEIMIALALAEILAKLGCDCVGPIVDLATRLEKAKTETLDAAILNLILRGGTAYGIAAILRSRNIPFAFASGVANQSIDPEWQDIPYIEKPYSEQDVSSVLQTLAPYHLWP